MVCSWRGPATQSKVTGQVSSSRHTGSPSIPTVPSTWVRSRTRFAVGTWIHHESCAACASCGGGSADRGAARTRGCKFGRQALFRHKQRRLETKGQNKEALMNMLAPILFDADAIRRALVALSPVERRILDEVRLLD